MTMYLVMEKHCICETEIKRIAELVVENQLRMRPESSFLIEEE